ncbi:hypothetical protein AnigIFM50267_002204 [Aspergillus niger]|nr:hypothetical protein AnigIFM50267_002204 [Aspergillus niger]
MEEKLYREAYDEITWFLHSSPKVKSIAIDRYIDLHYLYQVYRLCDFSDDIRWKISFSTIEEQHVFLRLLHLDDTNEEYKRLASKKEKARNDRSLLRSGPTPLSAPAVQNKEKLTGSGESNTKPQQFKDPQQKSPDTRIKNKNPGP